MSSVSIRLEGQEELLAQLKAIGAEVEREVEAALTSGAKPLVERANDLAPHPQILIEVRESRGGAVVVAVGFPGEKWYWRFFELGAGAHEIKGDPRLAFQGRGGVMRPVRVSHPGMAAEPFLRPAYDETHAEIVRRIGDYIRSVIEQC